MGGRLDMDGGLQFFDGKKSGSAYGAGEEENVSNDACKDEIANEHGSKTMRKGFTTNSYGFIAND